MARSLPEGCALRGAVATQEPRIRGGCHPHAGARNRREHGHLQRRICGAPEAPAISPAGPDLQRRGGDPGTARAAPEPPGGRTGLSRVAQSGYRLRHQRPEALGVQCHRRRGARASRGRAGLGQFLLVFGRAAGARPRLFGRGGAAGQGAGRRDQRLVVAQAVRRRPGADRQKHPPQRGELSRGGNRLALPAGAHRNAAPSADFLRAANRYLEADRANGTGTAE